jgi:hypothetical protein
MNNIYICKNRNLNNKYKRNDYNNRFSMDLQVLIIIQRIKEKENNKSKILLLFALSLM